MPVIWPITPGTVKILPALQLTVKDGLGSSTSAWASALDAARARTENVTLRIVYEGPEVIGTI